MARPYDNTTGAGVVADTMNVIVVSNFAFIIPTDIPSLMLSNEILLANKLWDTFFKLSDEIMLD